MTASKVSPGVLLGLAVVHALAPAGGVQQTVEKQMRVVESAVVVGAPERGAKEREVIVYLGDEPLEVTEVRRVGRDRDWTVLIYLDAPLTRSETLFRSALALAKSAARLTALGRVELLVAEPEVRVRVPPTRFPRAVENALAEVAMRASRGELGGALAALRRERVLRSRRTTESEAEHARAVRALVDRHVTELARAARERCRVDACLLLLVSEGFSETLAASGDPADGSKPARPAACCARASRRLARELAASRWLTGVVAIQEGHELRDIPGGQRPPAARQLDAAVPPENYWGNAATAPSMQTGPSISLEKLGLVLRLESAPLKRLARATGGFLVATPGELRAALDDLEDRLLVWFRHPADPPERARPLRVVFAPRGRELWAPRWWLPRPDATSPPSADPVR